MKKNDLALSFVVKSGAAMRKKNAGDYFVARFGFLLSD